MVIVMQPVASVSFFLPEFSDFLYAPIGAEPNEMPLSVLSALARLNIDPWQEAAELSALSEENAIQRLARLVGRLPGGLWKPNDCQEIAARLIKLLPRAHRQNTTMTNEIRGHNRTPKPPIPMRLIYIALAILFVIITASGGR